MFVNSVNIVPLCPNGPPTDEENAAATRGRHMVSFADQVPEKEDSMYAGRLYRVHYIESYKKYNRMTRDEI